jgi:hypothetical protein
VTAAEGSGNAAIATGSLWLGSTLSFLLLDPARGLRVQEEFYAAVAADPLRYQVPRLLLAVTAFVGLAAVVELWRAVWRDRGSDGWLHWSSLLVVVSLAVTGVSQLRFALLNPARAARYVEGDAVTRLAIEAGRYTLQLDPHAILATVTLIVWLVVVNLLALERKAWPRGACLLGFTVALLSVLGAGGRGLDLPGISRLTSLLNGVLAPGWFLWIGIGLRSRRGPA